MKIYEIKETMENELPAISSEGLILKIIYLNKNECFIVRWSKQKKRFVIIEEEYFKTIFSKMITDDTWQLYEKEKEEINISGGHGASGTGFCQECDKPKEYCKHSQGEKVKQELLEDLKPIHEYVKDMNPMNVPNVMYKLIQSLRPECFEPEEN